MQTVVVVDDDDAVRDAIVEALADAGYATLTAGDGAEALAVLRAAPRPCVALVDLVMPRVDGWELLHRIAAEPSLHDIAIVCVTAGRDEPPPCTGLLRKPFDAAQLVAAVRAAFTARGPVTA